MCTPGIGPESHDEDQVRGALARCAGPSRISCWCHSLLPPGRRLRRGYDVHYVNAFQTQPDERSFRRGSKARERLVLRDGGRPVTDEAWGEWLLDIRTAAKRERLARIVGRWIDRGAADGFDAVELGERGPRIGFDFAIAEECGRWRECAGYAEAYDDHVLVVEYRRRDFTWSCERFGERLSVVLRDRALSPDGRRAYC